jgi:O-acetylhomoserine (thiol)-lyase
VSISEIPSPKRVVSTHPETLALHGGWRSDPSNGAVSVPIFQTAAYEFASVDQAADIFDLRVDGNTYSRLMNPTCDVFEQRLSAIEGGVAALSLSSGQSAVALAVLNLAQAGDNIVASTDIYGGTWNLLKNTFGRMGIETRFVDPLKPSDFARATDERTRCYFGETLPNPKLQTFPIGEIAAIGREHGIPLIIDNTVAPLICRPIDHGAALVVYSTTKYICGHGTTIAGAIVDAGTFDWTADPKRLPLMAEPDVAHGNVLWKDAVRPLKTALGASSFILKARMTLLRDLGACLSPFNAFLLIQGLETLALRMKQHCENASAVAQYLQGHPAIARVAYPELFDGVAGARARQYLRDGRSPMVQCELAGGYDAGRKFIGALEMFYHVANVGDARSLALHPASTTHAQLDRASREAAGVYDGTIRLCIGIEHIDDIIADLDRALRAAA